MTCRLLKTVCLVVLAFIASACSRNSADSHHQQVDAGDAAMNSAIETARSTTGKFVAAFRDRPPGSANFYVKKPFRVRDGKWEHMWVEVLSMQNDVMTGRVANEAQETTEVKLGDLVKVRLSEISDWKYNNGRKLVGGYTIRYFIERMTPAQRAEFLKSADFEL